MVWLYVAVALIGFAAAFVFASLVKNESVKRRIGAWVGIMAGACFFLFYALEPDHELFVLAIGLMCWVVSVFAFIGESRRGTAAGGPP